MTILTNDKDKNFNLIIDAAYNVYPDNEVQADLAASQAILESDIEELQERHKNQGGSALAVKYNNLFGIKPGIFFQKGTDGTVDLPTHEFEKGEEIAVNAYFLRNNEIEDSFRQRQEILIKLYRYRNVVTATSVEEGAQGLLDGGWATEPDYKSAIMEIYNRFVKNA